MVVRRGRGVGRLGWFAVSTLGMEGATVATASRGLRLVAGARVGRAFDPSLRKWELLATLRLAGCAGATLPGSCTDCMGLRTVIGLFPYP